MSSMDKKSEFIWDKIRFLREDKHLTQSELAEAAEIPFPSYRDLEYGKNRNPRIGMVLSIIDALDVDISFVVKSKFKNSSENKNEPVTNESVKKALSEVLTEIKPQKKYDIPEDILLELEGQSSQVYSSIRSILSAEKRRLSKSGEKKKKAQ